MTSYSAGLFIESFLRICDGAAALSLVLIAILLSGCNVVSEFSSSCVFCHRGLEPVSPTHAECIDCHGGNAGAWDKRVAHNGMHGGKNPSDPRVWERTCGRCHPDQLNRVQSTLMTTNTVMIHNINLTWEGDDSRIYGSRQLHTVNRH